MHDERASTTQAIEPHPWNVEGGINLGRIIVGDSSCYVISSSIDLARFCNNGAETFE